MEPTNAVISSAKTPHKPRLRRVAPLLIGTGLLVMLFHSVVEDYAYGMTSKDGIYIPDASYDMAQNAKSGGEANTHTFRIYNLRPRWLQVQAKPDCGCTGTSWGNARIAPFGWKDISTTMKAKKGQKPSVSITFETDSTNQKRVFAFLAS